MYKTILLRDPQTSKTMLMKKIQFNALLYFHNGRSIKKMKLQFISLMIISVLNSKMKNEFKIFNS